MPPDFFTWQFVYEAEFYFLCYAARVRQDKKLTDPINSNKINFFILKLFLIILRKQDKASKTIFRFTQVHLTKF